MNVAFVQIAVNVCVKVGKFVVVNVSAFLSECS